MSLSSLSCHNHPQGWRVTNLLCLLANQKYVTLPAAAKCTSLTWQTRQHHIKCPMSQLSQISTPSLSRLICPKASPCHPERSEGSVRSPSEIQSSRSEPALERSEGMTSKTALRVSVRENNLDRLSLAHSEKNDGSIVPCLNFMLCQASCG